MKDIFGLQHNCPLSSILWYSARFV